jgi:hypothetical protein
MVDQSGGNGAGPGDPVRRLSEFEEPVRRGFFGRLRRKIERRSLTSQLLGFSWHLPLTILLEFLGMFFQLVVPEKHGEGGSK